MKGAYILLIVTEKDEKIEIGALGKIFFKKGRYCYVGSALGPGGIEARVERHLKKRNKLRWHIDYLLQYAAVERVYYSTEMSETDVVRHISKEFTGISGFGSSDSPFRTHLFVCEKEKLIDFLRDHPIHPLP